MRNSINSLREQGAELFVMLKNTATFENRQHIDLIWLTGVPLVHWYNIYPYNKPTQHPKM